MSHNYALGLMVLILAFVFFYTPLLYAFFKIRQQHRQQEALQTEKTPPSQLD